MNQRSWNRTLSRRRLLQAGAGAVGAAAMSGYAASLGARVARAQMPDFSGRTVSVIAHSGHDLYLPTTVIPAFEEATGAKVIYDPIPGGDLNTRWATMAAAQDGTNDILYGNANHAATFANSIYEDIAGSANPDLVAGIVEPTRQASFWDNQLFFLGMDSLEWIFLWNTEMYEAAGLDPNVPPQNFDEYVDMSIKLTQDGRFGTHLPMIFFYYTLLYNSTGGELLTDGDHTLNADSPESKLALEGMKRLVDADVVSPAAYSPDISFDAGEGFRTEQIAHYIGATSHYPRSQNPELATTIGKVKTGLVPGLNLRSGSSTGNEGFGVNRYSENKDVALAFAEFLHTDDMQVYVALDWGRGPGQQKFVDDSDLLDPNLAENEPHIATLLEQVQYPARRYQAPFNFDLDRLFTDHIQRMLTGQQTIDEAASIMQTEGQEIVDAYWASVA